MRSPGLSLTWLICVTPVCDTNTDSVKIAKKTRRRCRRKWKKRGRKCPPTCVFNGDYSFSLTDRQTSHKAHAICSFSLSCVVIFLLLLLFILLLHHHCNLGLALGSCNTRVHHDCLFYTALSPRSESSRASFYSTVFGIPPACTSVSLFLFSCVFFPHRTMMQWWSDYDWAVVIIYVTSQFVIFFFFVVTFLLAVAHVVRLLLVNATCKQGQISHDLLELLEKLQTSRLDDQRCVLPAYFTQVRNAESIIENYKTNEQNKQRQKGNKGIK